MEIAEKKSEKTKVHFNAILKEFLLHCEFEKNLNPNTISAYKVDLLQFDYFITSNKYDDRIEQISKETIKLYLKEIAKFKPKTTKRKVASLKAMLSYYEYENDNFINPLRRIKIQIKEPFVLPAVMSANEVQAILNRLYNERENNLNIKGATYKMQTRNIAIFELLFATGMRVSELCQLKYSDVDLSRGQIKIFGKGSKERIIQICSKEVVSILKLHQRLQGKNTYLFTNRFGDCLSSQSVRSLVRKYAQSLSSSKHITPHTFRHTFATLLLEADVDIKYIQHLLGHSSIATTQIYTHINNSKLKQILSTKHPRKKMNFSTQ